MHAKFSMFLLFIIVSFSSFAREPFLFTPLEVKMDETANEYGADSSVLLEKMAELIADSKGATPAELALLHTYDCSVRANLTSQLARESLQALQAMSVEHRANYSVRAATALCASNVYRVEKNYQEEEKAINVAFLLMKKSNLATLRYWIGVNINSQFQRLRDYRTAAEGIEIAAQVAIDNDDYFRQSVSLEILSDLNYKQGLYKEALKQNELAEKAFNKLDGEKYIYNLYSLRAKIHIQLNDNLTAAVYLDKASKNAKEMQQYRIVQFINLEQAYLALLTKKASSAKSYIDEVTKYAQDFNDPYLLNSAYFARSSLLLMNPSPQNLSQSEQYFNDALQYFEANNYAPAILEGWRQRAVIAQLSGENAQAIIALKKYDGLMQSTLFILHQQSQLLFYQANEQIWADTEALANAKFDMLDGRFEKQKKRNIVLFAIAVIASIVLVLGLLNRFYRWRKQQQAEKDEIDRQRYYDPLTNSFNRRYFDEHIVPRMLNDSLENSGTLLTLDIDHFKKFNDTFGHQTGDEVLKEVVNRLQNDSRFSDTVVRTGGEEFLILLSPQERIRPEAAVMRILKLISSKPMIIEDKPETITISIGFISLSKLIDHNSVNEMLNLADKALYLAKKRGRNRAIGIHSLECSYDVIDNIEVAFQNKLLKLNEIVG